MNTNLQQNNLVNRCMKGERSAQYEMYHQYSKAMYNVALRILGNQAEAEDALQMSFVKVFQNLDQYRADATLGAWIKRIVVNHCLTEMRKRKVVFEEIDEEVMPIPLMNTDDHYESQYDIQTVKKAINLLSDGYRTIFSLYLLEGYDHAEIGAMMNISESTSKSQLSRAKKKVKELVKALSS